MCIFCPSAARALAVIAVFSPFGSMTRAAPVGVSQQRGNDHAGALSGAGPCHNERMVLRASNRSDRRRRRALSYADGVLDFPKNTPLAMYAGSGMPACGGSIVCAAVSIGGLRMLWDWRRRVETVSLVLNQMRKRPPIIRNAVTPTTMYPIMMKKSYGEGEREA